VVVVEGSMVSTSGWEVGLEVAMGPGMVDEEDRATPPPPHTHQSHVKIHGSSGWQTMYGRAVVGHDPTGLVVVDWMVAERE
jgi:hypothetical protein